MSTKPNAWTLSPQLTAAPELWRGCVMCLPFWNIEPSEIDIASGRVITPLVDTSGSIDKDMGINGVRAFANNGSDSNTGAYYEFSVGDYNLTGKNLTLFAVAQVDRLSSNRSGSQDQVLWGWSANQYAPYFNNNNQIQLWNGSSTGGSTSFQAGELYSLISIFDFSSSEFTLYINGVFNNTLGSFNSLSASQKIRLFQEGGTTRSFEGRCEIAAIWDRKLTDGEMQQLYEDPFAMLRPAGF